MQAIGYCRVSSDGQAQDGTSLETQANQINAYATMKSLSLTAIFSDAGVSGGLPIAQRPEGAKLSALVETGEVDTVIIAKLDRGFRNTVDALTTIEAWDKAGVSLVILDMGGQAVDTRTPMGKFFLTTIAAVGALERDMIKARCAAGRAVRKLQGKRIGTVPYGKVADTAGNLLESPEELAAIRTMVELRENGLSYRAIAEELDRRGVRPKCGKAWKHSSVKGILMAEYERKAA